MPYTTEDGGRLNNFANEPKMYQAEPPTAAQKRNYVVLGVGCAGFCRWPVCDRGQRVITPPMYSVRGHSWGIH